jgi:hypothetical protein
LPSSAERRRHSLAVAARACAAVPFPMESTIMWSTLLLAGALAVGTPIEPLTLAAAVRLSAEREPTALAAEHEVAAAAADADFAARLPAPMWMVGIQDLPITGMDAGSFGADEMTMRMVGVEQMWPSARMREAGRDAALAMGDVARVQAEAARRTRARKAGRMWVEGWRAGATARVLRAEIAALDAAIAAAQVMAKSEPGGAEEALMLDVERAEIEAMAEVMDGEHASVEDWFAAELGAPVALADAAPDWTLPESAQLDAAIERHPRTARGRSDAPAGRIRIRHGAGAGRPRGPACGALRRAQRRSRRHAGCGSRRALRRLRR